MKNKILTILILCMSLACLSGCYKAQADEISNPDIIEEKEEIKDEIAYKKITDSEMRELFTKYLDLDEELILTLNQKPKTINSEYLNAYINYEKYTNEILGKYLSDETKKKLQQQHIQDGFNYFRFIQMNNHLITGIDKIEDVEIISKKVNSDNVIYEVDIVATVDTIDYEWSKKKYTWSKDKGYYINNIILDPGISREDEPGLDKIRVSLSYLVEVPKGDKFNITSIKEKEGINMGMEERGSVRNNKFAKRLPYQKSISNKEKEKISQFLDVFMRQDYNYYTYYRLAYDTNYETFKASLENDLGLFNVVGVDKATYKERFNPEIIPIKDNIESIDFNIIEDVTIIPHISSSEKIHVYEVNLETQITLLNQDVVAYEYTYLFTLENGIISSVRAVAQNEIEII